MTSEIRERPLVTMKDVASAADVSVATVSRVLAGSRAVTPDAEQAVRRAAKQLGYRRNTVASALRTNRTATIGMVVPDLENPFFPSVIKALDVALQDAGSQMLLCDAQNGVSIEAERVESLLERRVDGLVISPVHRVESEAIVRRAQAFVPVVQVDRRVEVATDWVAVDQKRGIRLILDLLRNKGCRSFAFVTSTSSASTSEQRHRAYTQILREHALEGGQRILINDFSAAWGAEAGGRLVDEGLPDGIVCGNDLIAVGVLQALRERGVDVPADVLVTGIDDTLFGRVSVPTLTSLSQPLEELGRESVRLLQSRLGATAGPFREVTLAPHLMERTSTSRTAS